MELGAQIVEVAIILRCIVIRSLAFVARVVQIAPKGRAHTI